MTFFPMTIQPASKVMGLYPGDPGPPGADCGATVLGLGDTVTHLRLAEDVFGESPGCGKTQWVDE